ncbi:hypothetical protein MUK42_33895 [Musa troglodytarum]|uniref:Uncharacterized protein n=1 Tax=Musa troglodytarum TaxID=320322 RepID=A0A9E7K1Y3_9LILI|nr:hypothetical protein MUK42_33895 [Musa troglodytarum]
MHWRKPQSTGAGRDLKKITRYRFRVFSGRDEVTPSFPFSPFFTSESAQTSRRLPSDGGRLGFDPWSAADTKIIVDTPRRRSPSSTLLTAPTPGSSHALASQLSFMVSFGMLGIDGASVTLEFGFVERKLLTVIKFVPLIFCNSLVQKIPSFPGTTYSLLWFPAFLLNRHAEMLND